MPSRPRVIVLVPPPVFGSQPGRLPKTINGGLSQPISAAATQARGVSKWGDPGPKVECVNIYEVFVEAGKKHSGDKLTSDGVHLSTLGHQVTADALLSAVNW